MAYIIPGIPPRPAPDAPGLLSPRGVAASLARSTAAARNLRYLAEQDAFRVLDDAAEAVRRTCLATHHLECRCYLDAPETAAMMAWRSNFCSHCGGEGRCRPGCKAADARH